jgi:hypothetical protein
MLHRQLSGDLPDYPAGRQDNYCVGKLRRAPRAPPALWHRFREAAAGLEHVQKKLFDGFESGTLQFFDFELRPYHSNGSI